MYRGPTTQMTTYTGPHRTVPAPVLLEGVDAMGRGRQKAKQTKVARKLKYFSPETDYRALERELTSRTDDVDGDDYGDQIPPATDDWGDIRSTR
ncbi:hypothetical protein GCM10022262_03290 [Georgenia daeguensis]|uniref:DUF3073 family protein n=2 Tax=Georgenia daeguensis TaxID=908355 RepID=A0ABP8EPX2_9MICO